MQYLHHHVQGCHNSPGHKATQCTSNLKASHTVANVFCSEQNVQRLQGNVCEGTFNVLREHLMFVRERSVFTRTREGTFDVHEGTFDVRKGMLHAECFMFGRGNL